MAAVSNQNMVAFIGDPVLFAIWIGTKVSLMKLYTTNISGTDYCSNQFGPPNKTKPSLFFRPFSPPKVITNIDNLDKKQYNSLFNNGIG